MSPRARDLVPGARDLVPGARHLALLVVLAIGLGGCERGCLSVWLRDHGAGGDGDPFAPSASGGERSRSPGASAGEGGASSLDLEGTDCSDGLARCTDGRVETSVAGHVAYPCAPASERGGACACRWQRAGTCPSGCVVDGLEVVATPEAAVLQLCRAPELVLRPLLPTESLAASVCADEGVACVEGIVRTCVARGQPARLVAACTSGCAAGVTLDPGDVMTGDGAAAILCQRAHAERR